MYESVKTVYKKCLFLVKSRKNMIGFCLKLKTWIRALNSCPNQCPYFIKSQEGNLEVTELKKYNIECIYFTRIKNEQGSPIFYCDLMMQRKPFCQSCHFFSYGCRGFEDLPFPYIYYFPYPKNLPDAFGSMIPKIITCPYCYENCEFSEKFCPSCGNRLL